ncbi:ribose ABC transporter permease [Spirochaetia bacterium]|nr:ribose ABC transporter permease [Spirochaetia bacterium]
MPRQINAKTVVSVYEKFGILLIMIIECIFFAIASNRFLLPTNLFLVGRQVSFYGIAAVGVTMVLLVGEIDISVGSILGFSGTMAAVLMVKHGWPMGLAILVTILFCTIFGFISGFLTEILKVPSLIGTLAMQTIIKGCTYIISDGRPIRGFSEKFKFLGQGFVFGTIPTPIIFMVLVFIIGFIVLNKQYIGRRIYAVGGNKEAARLSGIKTNWVVVGVFVASSVTASVAGILMVSRLGAGDPSLGSDFALDVLTAAVLGGIALQGGKGFVLNVLVGAFIIGILANGLVLCHVIEYWQWIVKGLVFLFAVIMSNLDYIITKKR